jgi:hypothetical protein
MEVYSSEKPRRIVQLEGTALGLVALDDRGRAWIYRHSKNVWEPLAELPQNEGSL